MNQQANNINNAIENEKQGCLHTKRFRRRPYRFCVPSRGSVTSAIAQAHWCLNLQIKLYFVPYTFLSV